MSRTRRQFIATTGTVIGGIILMPYSVNAASHTNHSYETGSGTVRVHPVSHASMVLETPAGTVYVDPVGNPDTYSDFPAPDLVLITHEHGDHYKEETLSAVVAENTRLITNPAVFNMLPPSLSANAGQLANGESTVFNAMSIEAVPAYNTTEGRKQFHPKGRDNGYVLTVDGFRIYISGDTEGIPEMRALEDIDLAFVCMNLPFTMDAKAAADAVAEFQPRVVYPYHFRGRDGGTQDPAEFAAMLSDSVDVRMADWYGGDL